MNNTQSTRRTVLAGAAWSVPAVAVAGAAPALAASPTATTIDQGVFVSTQYNGGYVGYQGSNNTGTTRPTTPEAYFSAVQAGNNPESDINWVDGSGPTNSSMYVNGEGSFTPVTNGVTGANGTYLSGSGYWFSVPTTAGETGTEYIPGSSTTLVAGAKFTTDVEVTVPNTKNGRWALENMKINGTTWNKQLTGNLTGGSASATYLDTGRAAGTWTAAAPTIVDNGDGTLTLRSAITFTTSQDVTVTQSGSKYYSQVIIMPAQIALDPASGWESFSLTSRVDAGTMTYTVPEGYAQPAETTVSGLLTTSEITPA